VTREGVTLFSRMQNIVYGTLANDEVEDKVGQYLFRDNAQNKRA